MIKTKNILIDGFNLIYKFPHLEEMMYEKNLIGAMHGLVDLIADYSVKAKKKSVIIFDGKRKEGDNTEKEKVKGVQLIYSHDLSADYVIMQSIKYDKQPKMTSVITSDKAIIGYLRKFGTPVVKSEDFAPLVTKVLDETEKAEEKPSDVSLSDEELSFWEKLFSSRK
ncbi:MAG: NYN domain-containing protein [Spirochaetes bacterium]|nr:NYN domain-containing protein [Spirochaetota bacterium]